MVTKNIFVGVSIAILVAAGSLFFLLDKTLKNDKFSEQNTNIQKVTVPDKIEKKYDLYNSTPYDLPFSSIVDISKLSESTKKEIDTLLEEAQGFYHLKSDNEGNIFIILQNPIQDSGVFPRHNLEFVEITASGKNIYSPVYAGIEGETINAIAEANSKPDIWKFDKSTEPYRPTKHTAYDEKGKVRFTEYWNYSEKDDVKYTMKSPKGKVLSILKETLDGDSNYRREHIFYNEDGNVELSISVNYDGANISRFTYYDTLKAEESVSIISEYEDGLKIKEQIYDANYNLIKTFVAKYTDTLRTEIQTQNSEGNVLSKISS